MEYTIIITKTREEADVINEVLPKPTDRSRREAYAYGHSLCGLRHGAQRPNGVISQVDMTEDDPWLREVLRPAVAHDAFWVNRDDGVSNNHALHHPEWLTLGTDEQHERFRRYYGSLDDVFTEFGYVTVAWDREEGEYVARIGNARMGMSNWKWQVNGYGITPTSALHCAAINARLIYAV